MEQGNTIKGSAMAKKRLSAGEIETEIARRITSHPNAACRHCLVGPVQRLEERDAGRLGVNWICRSVRGPSKCWDAMARVVSDVSSEYDCSDW